jgi:metal-responsive CopG/Arc/MetJ family transcriptional regulator
MAEEKEESVQLVASGIPQSLIDDVDDVAEIEVSGGLSRSRMVRILLEEGIAARKAANKAKGGGGNRTRE